MNHSISISSRAQKEITEAFLWYEQQRSGLGVQLMLLLEKKLELLQQNPNLYPTVYKAIHRSLIKKFPYSIFYIVDGNTVEILAFFHMKRKPIRWI